jgi:iron complex outermembrane receptor protein
MHMALASTPNVVRRLWAVALFFLAETIVLAAAGAARRQFDLPADTAERSLKRLSVQSGVQIVFAAEITDGVFTNPVRGTLTAQEAAELLVAGTPLRVTHDGKTGVLSVTRGANPERASPEKKAGRASLTMAGDRPIQPSPTSPSTNPPKT